MDFVNIFSKAVMPLINPEEKQKATATFLANEGASLLKNIQSMITLYGQNGHSVGDSLTLADLMISELDSNLLAKAPGFVDNFPIFKSICETVSKNEKVAAYIKSRPETPF